jgi:hypothetical protein
MSLKQSDKDYIAIGLGIIAIALFIFYLKSKAPRIQEKRVVEQVDLPGLSDAELAKEVERMKRIEEEDRRELKEFYKTKAGRIYRKHPEWSLDDCRRLADNSVWIGMSLEMLKYKRGLPNNANPSNYGNGVQWQWCWSDYTPSCFYDNNNDGLIDSYN